MSWVCVTPQRSEHGKKENKTITCMTFNLSFASGHRAMRKIWPKETPTGTTYKTATDPQSVLYTFNFCYGTFILCAQV